MHSLKDSMIVRFLSRVIAAAQNHKNSDVHKRKILHVHEWSSRDIHEFLQMLIQKSMWRLISHKCRVNSETRLNVQLTSFKTSRVGKRSLTQVGFGSRAERQRSCPTANWTKFFGLVSRALGSAYNNCCLQLQALTDSP